MSNKNGWNNTLEISDLQKVFVEKYGDLERLGPGPLMRSKFGYYGPDDYYEALLSKLVIADTEWLDVGCGRNILPTNWRLAETLAARCSSLVGVDPDDTLDENPYVHEKIKISINEYQTNRRYDLITLRMVLEHIDNPANLGEVLAACTKKGSLIVAYTVFKWSILPMLARLAPFSVHNPIKKVFWGTEDKDTFPVAYKMNTRSDLNKAFHPYGFKEVAFWFLDDCRTSHRFLPLHYSELLLWAGLKKFNFHYPETCLLGVYKRSA